MSIQRQPAGSPNSAGGRFAPSGLAESFADLGTTAAGNGYTNLAPGVDADMIGTCFNCNGVVGFQKLDGVAGFVHLNADGSLTEVSRTRARRDEPLPDPELYTGDTSCLDGRWTTGDWERFYSARDARNEQELDERRTLDATGGIDLNQDPARVRGQALEVFWRMQELSLQAGLKSAAAEIIAEHPDAAFLVLDHGDQGAAWYATGIANSSDLAVADFEEFENEHSDVVYDIPHERALHGYPWAVLSDVGLPKIDLRKAAQIDLNAIFEQESGA